MDSHQKGVLGPSGLRDGVFVREPDGSLSFAAAEAPTDREIKVLLDLIRKRILRLLVRPGVAV
jgi:hypothetical protein